MLAIAGCAAMLIGTAWTSRVTVDTGYLLGIACPMIVFGIGQGLGLSSLTTAGMAGVARRDAAVAGGLVNVAHHLGGAIGLGILVTVFDAAGSAATARGAARRPRLGRAHRRLPLPRARAHRDPGHATPRGATATAPTTRASPPDPTRQGAPTCRSPAAASTPRRARPTGSPATSTSTPSPRPQATSTFAAALVHFTPGARTAWHTHPHGQTIFVTEGVGRCQREGGPIEEIRPGDRVFFEPGENHWHGAAPNRFMAHIAMQQNDESGSPVPGASTSPTSSTTAATA